MRKKYEVMWDYVSAGVGPFLQGEMVELTEAEAAWINADSPGVLREIASPEARNDMKDRMVKRAPKKR